MYKYILVTPAKNEEPNLPKLIRSIVNQRVKPVAWFIVDDSSQDGTRQILDRAASAHPWIHIMESGIVDKYDNEEHLSVVLSATFERAYGYCDKNGISFDYVAVSDADMCYGKDYFYSVIGSFHGDEKLGIASGRIVVLDAAGNARGESMVMGGHGYPNGAGRVWDKRCFDETGGIAISKAWDAVSNTAASLKGWEVRQLGYDAYQLRDTGGKYNLWTGYYRRGVKAYYLGINPLGILNKIIDMMFISREKRSVIKSSAYAHGYARSLVHREKRIDDPEVRRYMGSYKRVLKSYLFFAKQIASKIF